MAEENGLKVTTANGDISIIPEANEADPCMGKDAVNKKKGHQQWFLECRDRVCQNTGLSHRGAYVAGGLILLLVLLVVVVIALAAAWPRNLHKYQFPVCRNSACLKAAAQVQESLNSSFLPCGDLWNWSCGGWLQKYPMPPEESLWNQKRVLLKQEYERIRDMITTLKLPVHIGTVEWKLKHLYEACLDVDNVNIDEARPLTRIISELGGWYILRDLNMVDFDAKMLMKRLHVSYGVTPFFQISVTTNPHLPHTSSIRISPSGLGLPDKEYYFTDQDNRIQVAYNELIRDIGIYMGATRNEAEKFGKDIFYYEKRIAEITPSLEILRNPIASSSSILLSELKEISPTIPFQDILAAMYPEYNLSEHTEIIVSSLEYLMQVSQIVASTDRRTMNGYLIWTLVKKYLPYLSDKYTSAMDNFKSELFGVREPFPRWERCAKIISNYMTLAVNYIDNKDYPVAHGVDEIVNITYSSIKDVVYKRIASSKYPELLRQHLLQKLNKMTLQISFPEATLQEKYVKDYFLKLKIIKSTLFESIRNAIIFKKNLEENYLVNKQSTDNIMEYAVTNPTDVIYVPSDNTIFIPRILLKDPYFEAEYPLAIIYGRLGVEIAKAIISAVFPYGSFWTSDGKLLSEFHAIVNDSIGIISGSRNCLKAFILDHDLDLPSAGLNETALEALKHIGGIKITHEALQNTLLERNHIHQPSLEEYEDSPLFFLSNAQTHCSEVTNQRNYFENVVKFHINHRALLHVAWSQIVHYPEAFECSYNKKFKCSDIFD